MITIRSAAQKRLLRAIVAARHKRDSPEWLILAEIDGTPYQVRTACALVGAGYLERAPGVSEPVYKPTLAGIAWVRQDANRDSRGWRRGGPRPHMSPELLARARDLLAEKTEDGGGYRYNMQEVAAKVGVNRDTLSLHLFPQRRKRRNERRRTNYRGKE